MLFLGAGKIRVRGGVFADRHQQHLTKEIELAHELFDTITLLPAPSPMPARIALDRAFLLAHVVRFEHDADFIEDIRQMIRELPVRELIRMLDFLVAEHQFHPSLGERLLLRAQRGYQTLRGVD